MLIAILTTLHIVICLFLILVVLLQQGKGADLSVFGGGSTQAVFGARGAATILHKLTVAGFVGFIVTTIAIGFLTTGTSSRSVMSDAVQEESAPAEAEAPAGDAGAAPAEGDAGTGPQAVTPEAGPAEEAEEPPAEGGEGDGSQ